MGSIPIKHTKIYEPCWEKMLREYYSAQRRKGQRLHLLHRVREAITLCFIALNSQIIFLGFVFSLDSYICLFCSFFLLKNQNDYNKIKALSPYKKKANHLVENRCCLPLALRVNIEKSNLKWFCLITYVWRDMRKNRRDFSLYGWFENICSKFWKGVEPEDSWLLGTWLHCLDTGKSFILTQLAAESWI